MSSLGKACPSGRLCRADLIQKSAYGRSQYVGGALYFGPLPNALTPLAHNLRAGLVDVIQLEPGFGHSLGRADPSGRLRPTDLVKSFAYGVSSRVTQDLFFGHLKAGYPLGILVTPVPGSVVVLSTAITVFLIDVLTPPIGTVLLDPGADVLLTMTLVITRPRDFLPPASGGGNAAYAG